MSQDVASKLESHGLKLIKKLGEGGMANVYLAEDVNLGRKLAVKVILPHLAQNTDFVSRFLREVKTLARLDHPAIPAIYQFASDGDFLFYTMRYVEGETLTDLLTRKNKLSPEEFARIATPIADALDYAHKQGIVHRDIKPDNIIVGNQIFLMDFGIAKILENEAATRTGSFIGTLNYASPEQLEGGAVGGESDIYSLGVLAYQALSGQLPFTGGQSAIISGHLTKEPPALTNLPKNSIEAVKKALSKNPSHRYKLAREFTTAIHSTSAGSPSASYNNLASEHTRVLSAQELHSIAASDSATTPQRRWLRPVLSFCLAFLIWGINDYLDYYMGESYLDCRSVQVVMAPNAQALCDNNLGTLWQHRISKNYRSTHSLDGNIFIVNTDDRTDGIRIFYPQSETRNNKGTKIKKLMGVYGQDGTFLMSLNDPKKAFVVSSDSDEDKYISIPIPANMRGDGIRFVVEELFNPQQDLILSDIRPYQKNYSIEILRTAQTFALFIFVFALIRLLPAILSRWPNKIFDTLGLSNSNKDARYSYINLIAFISIVCYNSFFLAAYRSRMNGVETTFFLLLFFVWIPYAYTLVPSIQNSRLYMIVLSEIPLMTIFIIIAFFSTYSGYLSDSDKLVFFLPVCYALFAKILATFLLQKLAQGKWRTAFKIFTITNLLIILLSVGFIVAILITKHIDLNQNLEIMLTALIVFASLIFWNTLSIKYFIRRLRS